MTALIFFFRQSRVSLKRLADFLTKDELDPDCVRSLPSDSSMPAVQVSDATFSWGKDEPTFLKHINLNIADGELVAIVGQVGCGKSSLVAAMLGLMEKVTGDVGVKGRLAYFPQVRKMFKYEQVVTTLRQT
jgi:ABC-type bacteriocin/lantibiotic exporter with double-glycine peptidase domain